MWSETLWGASLARCKVQAVLLLRVSKYYEGSSTSLHTEGWAPQEHKAGVAIVRPAVKSIYRRCSAWCTHSTAALLAGPCMGPYLWGWSCAACTELYKVWFSWLVIFVVTTDGAYGGELTSCSRASNQHRRRIPVTAVEYGAVLGFWCCGLYVSVVSV